MAGLHVGLLNECRAAGLPIELGTRVPWLSGRGHLSEVVQQRAPTHVLTALACIHRDLGGDAALLAEKRLGNPPTPDLVHIELGCVIEVDEVQHFSSARLRSLDEYPDDVMLGFDLTEYRMAIGSWRSKADRAFAHRVSVDFPRPGGRQAQRAYNDALRDLLAPTFTGQPALRLGVPDRSTVGLMDRLLVALRRCV